MPDDREQALYQKELPRDATDGDNNFKINVLNHRTAHPKLAGELSKLKKENPTAERRAVLRS
jgi:hypothetical protein